MDNQSAKEPKAQTSIHSNPCSKCGFSLSANAKFCTSCGENQRTETQRINVQKKSWLPLVFIPLAIGTIYGIFQAAKVTSALKTKPVIISEVAKPMSTYNLPALAALCKSTSVLNKTILSVMY